MRKTAIFKNDLFLLHDPGPNHPERVDRLRVIYDYIEKEENQNKFIFPDFEPADLDQLGMNHATGLIDRISKTAGKMYDYLDQDTGTSAKSWEAALLAAGSLIKGVDMLADGKIDNGFALVRPPGHHAEHDRAMGFCLFNNIAVAARHAQTVHNMEKIMIVDWDLHHGNGTQFAFYDSDKVLYVSTHQFPFYPGTGALRETGVEAGEGYTVNIPLPGGFGDLEYAAIFNDIIVPVGHAYKPDLILVSAGFDIYHGDPLGSMSVNLAGFAYITRLLVELAEQVCDGKVLVTLEGGYNLKGQRDGALAVLSELLGAPLDEDGREFYLDDESEAVLRQAHGTHAAIDDALEKTRAFWKL